MSFNHSEESNPEAWENGLQEQQAINELKPALGSLQTGLRYAGVHDGILKLTFASNMHRIEFQTKKEQILQKMRLIYVEKKLHKKIKFTNVIAVYTNRPAKKDTKQAKLELPFDERSKGNFKNVCSGHIGSLFEEIRETIKTHTNHDPRGDEYEK